MLVLIALCLPLSFCHAQKDKNIIEQFNQAKEFNLAGKKDKSEEIYEIIIAQNKDNLVVKLLAQYHLAEVILRDYYREEPKYKIDYPRAKAYYEEIYKMRTFLNETANRKELSKFTMESYESIIHNTCYTLIRINLKLGDYREALTYANLSKNEYPSQISMNIDTYFDDYYQDLFIFKCYVGLQKPDSAVFVLLPYITKGITTASEAQDRVSELIAQNQISKKELAKYLNSIDAIVDNSKPSYLKLVTIYAGLTIVMDSILLNQDMTIDIDSAKKAYSDKIKVSFLYKSITKELEIPSAAYIRTLDHQQFKGKYTLLDFWASWCAPCREENPTLIKAYNIYQSKGFEIVNVSIDTDELKWQKAIKEDEIGKWQHLIDTTGWKSEILKEYHINSIPANFLIDQEGKIIAMNLRGEALLKKLEELLGE